MMKLIADSSANLTMLEGVTYQSVPMTIRAGERDFVDDETLDTHELLDYLAAHNGKSGTACPSLDGWLKAFEGADEIFVITITSSLSGTCAFSQTTSKGRPLACSSASFSASNCISGGVLSVGWM